MKAHTAALLVFAGSGIAAIAQAPLVPIWLQQWPYGQDAQPAMVPVSVDNRVAVDASTGNVYVSIDDQLQLVSPHFDRLFAFDAAGNDLTNPPTSLLGTVQPTENDPPNVESTHDLKVHQSAVYHMRELNTGITSGTTGSLHKMNLDGAWGWKLGLGKGGFTWGRGRVLVDDEGAVSIRSTDGATAMLQSTDHAGWIQWAKAYPPHGPFDDAVLVGNTIIAARRGTFVTIDRASGAELATDVVYPQLLAPMLATDGVRTYFVYSDFLGNTTWGCVIPGSASIWTRTAVLDITVTELEVDAFGRPWFIGNADDGASQPKLVVTASNGSSHDVFTYGASMNDLAVDDAQAYITGQVTAGSESTYLIAVSTDIGTSAQEPSAPAPITLHPQPAAQQLTVANAGRIGKARVVDLTGKAVPARFTGASLDVSGMAEGVYFLEAQTDRGLLIQRFAVAR